MTQDHVESDRASEPHEPAVRDIAPSLTVTDGPSDSGSTSQKPIRGGSDIEKRIDALQQQTEVDFVARESRLLPVLGNFFRYFRFFSSDPKSLAALRALAWKVFSPAAAGVGGLAIFGVVTSIYANLLLYRQNQKLDAQNYLLVLGPRIARGDAIGRQWWEIDSNTCRTDRACLDKAASLAKEATVYRRLIAFDDAEAAARSRKRSASKAVSGLSLSNLLPKWVEALSEETLFLEQRETSPERAWLFQSVYFWGKSESPPEIREPYIVYVGADLRNKRLSHINTGPDRVRLDRSVLTAATIDRSTMANVFLHESDLTNACITDVVLVNARLHGSTLLGAVLHRSVLPTSENFSGVDLFEADLTDAFVDNTAWIEAVAKVARNFTPGLWRAEAITAEDQDKPYALAVLDRVSLGPREWYRIRPTKPIPWQLPNCARKG